MCVLMHVPLFMEKEWGSQLDNLINPHICGFMVPLS